MANILSMVVMVVGFYINTIINRRHCLMGWAILDGIDCISYLILGATSGIWLSIYSVIKRVYLLVRYKEEKIQPNKIEATVIGIPYLIIGVWNFAVDGIIAIILGLAKFVKAFEMVFNKDIYRYLLLIITTTVFIIYNVSIKNYVAGLRFTIEVVIFALNIFRIKNKGEEHYYKNKVKESIENEV